MKRIYLASPYSHKQEFVEEYRFNKACRCAGDLIELTGNSIHSPIAHSHPIHCTNRQNKINWLKQDQWHLDTADELWVLMLDGWRESFGVTWEMIYGFLRGMPIRFVDPITLEIFK